MVVIAVLVAALSAVIVAGAFGDDGRGAPSGEMASASAAARAEAARMPPCTRSGRPTNFAVHTLGARFAGLEQTDTLRRCDRPELLPRGVVAQTSAGDRHAIRANFASVFYGACKARSDSGCAPPLEIQTWPACERSYGSYAGGRPPRIRIRGTSAAVFDGGTRIELYTARVTVVVFGDRPSLVRRAASAVVPVAAGSRFPPRPAAASGAKRRLARPARGAIAGRLACRSTASISSSGGV